MLPVVPTLELGAATLAAVQVRERPKVLPHGKQLMLSDSCMRPNRWRDADLVICIPVVGFANVAAAAQRLNCDGCGLNPLLNHQICKLMQQADS